MNIFKSRGVMAVAVTLIMSLVPTIASANTQLCLKKEISSDGITWYDANTESEAVVINDAAHFRFTAFKCPEAWGGIYGIVLTDPQIGVAEQLADLSAAMEDRTPSIFTTQIPDYCDGYEGTIENVAHVEGYSMVSDTIRTASDNAWARCTTVHTGGDGCTPGYWRQSHHLDSWPINPDTLFSEIFDRDITIRLKKQGTISGPTMLEAVAAKGGQVNTAARHAVAAYLNALSSDVNYDMDTASVIDAFQISFDNDDYGPLIENLVNFNEQSCPLN